MSFSTGSGGSLPGWSSLACCVGRARLAPLEAPSALRQAEPRVNIDRFRREGVSDMQRSLGGREDC
jgi:hypothetical protein